jgi:hypothetical protein
MLRSTPPLRSVQIFLGMVVPATVVDRHQTAPTAMIDERGRSWEIVGVFAARADKRFEDLNGHPRPVFGPDGWPIEPAQLPAGGKLKDDDLELEPVSIRVDSGAHASRDQLSTSRAKKDCEAISKLSLAGGEGQKLRSGP